MARIHTIGFELNDLAKENLSAPINSLSIQTSVIRSGTYAGRLTSLASGTRRYTHLGFNSTTSAEHFFRFYLRVATRPSADNMFFAISANHPDFAGNDVNLLMTSAGELKLRTATTQQGSTTSALSLNTWYRIEVRYKPGASSTGVVELWIDGTKVAENTGVTLANFRYITWGGNLAGEAQTQGDWFFDDIAINDTSGSFQTGLPGDGKVIRLLPNAAGDNNTLAKTGGGAGDADNYTEVDEITPDDATSYVRTSGSIGVQNTDDYNVQDSGIGASDTVNVIQVGTRFRVGGTSADQGTLRIKAASAGSVTSQSFTALASNSWQTNYVSSQGTGRIEPILTVYEKPGGGAWTQSDLDSMQIGLSDPSNGGFQVDMTSIWAYVDYTPSGGGSSTSPSSSISASVSPSASRSPSASISPSSSISASISPSSSSSSSLSPSASRSPSSSSSASLSPSSSASRSTSPSSSLSPSSSASASISPSSSASPSPSLGYQGYTRGDEENLPANNNDLETAYSAQDYTDVEDDNNVRVGQTGTAQYMLHQFKDFVGGSASVVVEWQGQTDLAPSASTVFLQVYNHDTEEWETIDSDNASNADTDFILTASIPDLTNYKDIQGIMSCRVYQLAT